MLSSRLVDSDCVIFDPFDHLRVFRFTLEFQLPYLGSEDCRAEASMVSGL